MATTIGLVVYLSLHTRSQGSAVLASPSSPGPNDTGDEAPPPLLSPAKAKRREPRLLPDPLLSPDDSATAAERPWLPQEEQEQVNKAINRGVEWLKQHQNQDGNWENRVGLAALPALTLLECGVDPDDSHIRSAREHVRKAVPTLQTTYDLALVILFLDRLGDPADQKLIQTCALRVVAGQSATGGWSYDCPVLDPEQESNLLTIMRARKPKSSLDLFVGGPGGSAPPGFLTRDPKTPLDKDIQDDTSGDSKLLPEGGLAPLDSNRPSPADSKQAWNRLPPELRQLPSLQSPKKAHKLPPVDGTDNSNTQFATLGLLAAGRHNLPLERAYALIVQRFHVSQVPDGRWNYQYSSPAQAADLRPAMTGAGLLGLAVQYGLAHDQAPARAEAGHFKDPAVEKGFEYLASFIGNPTGAKKPRDREADINLYFLWTVERCGVLFHRRQIGGKNWYPWGVELVIDRQQEDGSWNNDGYFAPPAITPITDTCFALLFLKRANLAKELTKKLEFFMEGKQLRGSP